MKKIPEDKIPDSDKITSSVIKWDIIHSLFGDKYKKNKDGKIVKIEDNLSDKKKEDN